MKKNAGLTLMELIVSVAIISIGILAVVYSYRFISSSIQYSKQKTLANNLVMEQIEKLKNLQYYSLLVTTATYSDNRFTPPLLYDVANYPLQTLVQGGITFMRGTRVDYAYTNGTTITTAAASADDTGMKQITVYVMWQDNWGLRYLEVHNLMTNPAANTLSATIHGTVTDSGSHPIAGAVVKTIQNPNYFALTDSAGSYSFNVSSGSYVVNCSSQGYFSADKSGKVIPGGSLQEDFVLNAMSSGTVFGTAYVAHLVVSQVVVSTDTGGGSEYVELYNPTASPVTIKSGGTVAVNFYVFDRTNNSIPTGPLSPVALTYANPANSVVPAHGYYLIANTTTVHAAGATVVADAYYADSTYWAPQHLIPQGEAGGLGVADVTPNKIDAVAWSKTSSAHNCPATPTEGTCMPSANGLQPAEQLVRYTDVGPSMNLAHGRSFDADNNATDFWDNPAMTVAPNNSASPAQNPTTGTPAAGAYVTSTDPLSNVAQCDSNGNFSITNVATGTWTLAFATGTYYTEVANVQMTPSLSTGVPNGSTSPAWPLPLYTHVLITGTTNEAFISGIVTDASNHPLSNIQILADGKTVLTNSSGRYFIAASTGDVLIVANNGNLNKAYASQSSIIYGAGAGVIYDNPTYMSPSTWFVLPLAGTLSTYFQTGSATALPGQTIVALSGGNVVAQAVSDNTGHAYLANLSTGTYTLAPSLDPLSTASPHSVPVTLSSTGAVTSVSTFTVTTGLAQITGQALIGASSAPISTGILVLASTASLGGTSASLPPTMNAGLGSLCAPCYYTGSSDSDGQYTLYVRSSTTSYQLYGWYTATPGSSPVRKGPYALSVSTAGVTVSKNMSW